jgi:hypothetical protein
MTENEQKQQFSIAYVHAVAARAGFTCQATLVDDDSVDVVIGARPRPATSPCRCLDSKC